MKINWFTVIAQVINFLILVWLLKKFLYKPVLDAIDAREKKIVARLDDAKNKKQEAKKEQDDFTEKNKQFDAQKQALMDKAIADTKVQKDKLMDSAQKEADALHSKQQKAFADMQENIKKNLAQKIQKQVFDISRKTLTDMASVDLEEQTTKLFISRLEQLKDEEAKEFKNSFAAGLKPVLIQSAFELPKKQQTEIKKAVDKLLGKETEFEFKTVPEIISGIELSENGYKLSWSISAYLDSLQNNILNTLKDEVKDLPEPNKATKKKQEPVHETAHEKK